jgi:hypothetical protein
LLFLGRDDQPAPALVLGVKRPFPALQCRHKLEGKPERRKKDRITARERQHLCSVGHTLGSKPEKRKKDRTKARERQHLCSGGHTLGIIPERRRKDRITRPARDNTYLGYRDFFSLEGKVFSEHF